ncbi:MAG: hypothetical protein OXN21_07170, partial [Chloroflexota bacterium]|nr:hypothetical protein [Chloroflexota bacterium]
MSAEVVADYASSQDSINAEWDQFHADFDQWRTGLTACDRTAVESALREFASDFAAITEEARALPGKGIARELPDSTIAAANAEEASLRLLRDNWQPGNPALMEQTQSERASAFALLRATQIEVDKLQELDDPEDREFAKEFAEELASVEEDWDAFYDSYNLLSDEQLDLAAAEIVTRLRELANEHESVVFALEDIPSDKVTDPVQDPLIEAAESEASALEDLIDTMRREARGNGESENGEASESAPGPGSEEPGTEGEAMSEGPENGIPGPGMVPSPGTSSSGLQGGPGGGLDGGSVSVEFPGGVSGLSGAPVTHPIPVPTGQQGRPQDSDGPSGSASESADYTEHFDTFEDTLDDTRGIRRKAGRDLDDLVEGFSESDRKDLSEFVTAFRAVMRDLNAFHEDFDAWVRTEGDCNRASAINSLNHYSQRFNELGNRVRNLSQASYLRPSSDLIVEAANREGAALRSLANTWAPYESDVYRGLDEERTNADNLR